ncbi:hypothetical protein HUJ04_005156 [Dendroctonus ponderosae]|nr:hypothetical protein HUJ04_005156 [Dendroctonus ponderosae]
MKQDGSLQHIQITTGPDKITLVAAKDDDVVIVEKLSTDVLPSSDGSEMDTSLLRKRLDNL